MSSTIDEIAEAEAAQRRYFRLLAFSETPQSRLRLPREKWQDFDNFAAALLDLLRLVSTVQYSHHGTAAAQIAALTPVQLHSYDEALQAIGETRQRRLLGLLYRRLVAPIAAAPPTQRHTFIAARLKDDDPILRRIWYAVDEAELELRLCNYLDAAAGNPLAELPPHEAPCTSRSMPQAPRSSLQVGVDSGPRHLFLLRDSVKAKGLLDTWIRNHPATKRYGKGYVQPVASYAEALRIQPQHAPFWGPLVGNVLGELLPDGAAPDYLHEHWLAGADPPTARLLDDMTRNFRWSVLRWNAPMGEHVLAWISEDAGLAEGFAKLLFEHGDAVLFTAYRGFDTLDDCTLGLTFGEDDSFGEAAMVAAAADGETPWLIASVRESHGHWWRAASAQLSCTAWHWTSDLSRNLALLIYRGDNLAAWRKLWSRIGENDNVAAIAVGGRLPLDQLRQRIVRIKDSISIDNLRYVAGSETWAYAHVWGGGADEHSALFFSRDPAVTARVAAFARERWPERWRWHGCW
ncbi:hypothetical protein ACFJIW_05850 [Tahibacter sp. UC22_41]|uniref:hypothetical protein n=1 Tax=Tahibacter sp. UC22_41 TaxID=3350178 RepID=UPI0036DC8F23